MTDRKSTAFRKAAQFKIILRIHSNVLFNKNFLLCFVVYRQNY
jgi:hypothetical protein